MSKKPGSPKMPLAARFYQKVEVRGPDECWPWHGTIIQNGYGQIQGGKGKIEYAHRVSYELHVGPVPTGLFVCHACDNKRCVNPNHLWVGTNSDNVRDAVAKGRRPKNLRPKLSPERIAEARLSAVPAAELARMWGVCYETVLNARHGRGTYARF